MAPDPSCSSTHQIFPWSASAPRLLAALVGVTALFAVAGLVSLTGNALPGERKMQLYRFCNGQCICDGGVADRALMERICPDGWQQAYHDARRKQRRQKAERRRQQLRQLQESPPPPSTLPSV